MREALHLFPAREAVIDRDTPITPKQNTKAKALIATVATPAIANPTHTRPSSNVYI
jgi:hypothetical protein